MSIASLHSSNHSDLDFNKDRHGLMIDQQAGKDDFGSIKPPSSTGPDLPEPLALNTRTMFFQPPPRHRKPPQQPDNNSSLQPDLSIPTYLSKDSALNESTASSTSATQGARLAQVSSRTQDHSSKPLSAGSSKQHTSPELSSSASYSNSGQQQTLASVFIQAPTDGTAAASGNGTSQLYKKGTIIASATTSQLTKGRGVTKLSNTSSRQQQHKSRALGVFSFSSSVHQGHRYTRILLNLSSVLIAQIFIILWLR